LSRLASNAGPLYGKASIFELEPMAEPLRAHVAAPRLPGTRFLIVEARYYESVAALLFEGAKAAFEAAGAAFDVVRVTGALEIPAGLAIALELASADGRPYDGAIALGCVIRGETYHFEIVAGESARALMDMAVTRRLALGNGVLTVETLEQAEERADPERGDKGGEAARAAIGLAALQRRLARR
jgi:6,7-dimethyl-8-ribityllumazine synthase